MFAHISKQQFILIATSISYIVVTLDTSIVNVALQSISNSFLVNISQLQWIVNAYTLAFASLILTAGTLGDIFGAKKIYLIGLLIFTASSLLCGFAPNINILIMARVLQGIGAALLIPNSLFLLSQNYPDPKQRAKAIGIWTGLASIALILGPLIGGIFIHFLSWRSIFLINFPICLIGLWLTIYYIPKQHVQNVNKTLDLKGQIFAILSLFFLVATLIEAPHLGWTSIYVFMGFAISALSLIFFLRVESTQKNPMMPLSIFKNLIFVACVYVAMVTIFVTYGLIFILSLYFQKVLDYSAFQTGLALFPMALSIMVANFFTAHWTQSHGAKRTVFLGIFLLFLGALFLVILINNSNYLELLFALIIFGFGGGLISPSVTAEMLNHVEAVNVGVASGILNTLRQTGGALGVAIFGSLSEMLSIEVGLHLSLLICGFLTLFTLVIWWKSTIKTSHA